MKISHSESGLDLKAPSLQKSLRDVFGVLVSARPLTKTGGADVLVRGEFVLLDDLLEGCDGGDHRANGFRLAPVGIAAALCHVSGFLAIQAAYCRNTLFYHFQDGEGLPVDHCGVNITGRIGGQAHASIDAIVLSQEQKVDLRRIAQSRSLPAGYAFRARPILMLAEGASYNLISCG